MSWNQNHTNTLHRLVSEWTNQSSKQINVADEKGGKTHANKSRVVLALLLIGRESGTCIVRQNHIKREFRLTQLKNKFRWRLNLFESLCGRSNVRKNSLLFFQAYVDKAFNREILELDVKCNQHEWGCKWEGEFQNAKVCKKKCDSLAR